MCLYTLYGVLQFKDKSLMLFLATGCFLEELRPPTSRRSTRSHTDTPFFRAQRLECWQDEKTSSKYMFDRIHSGPSWPEVLRCEDPRRASWHFPFCTDVPFCSTETGGLKSPRPRALWCLFSRTTLRFLFLSVEDFVCFDDILYQTVSDF